MMSRLVRVDNGPSTKNIRIESWWNALLRGQTRGWRKYFQGLHEEGLFSGSGVEKQALRYLYMQSIRRHLAGFVKVHNIHNIRRQKARAHHLPHGKPDEMFFYPPDGCRNYITEPEGPLLEHLEDQLRGYDPDLYIHPETESLCERIVKAEFPEFDLKDIQFRPGLEQQHVKVYTHLREQLFKYQENGGVITEVELPCGAKRWVEAMAERRQEQWANLEQERMEQEGWQDMEEIDLSEVEAEDNEEEEVGEELENDDGLEYDVENSD